MVPLAVGTQTNGSVIRPASFCGVYGLKPTHGLVPRGGVLRQSRALDTVGVLARSLEDVALALETLAGHDELDPDTRPVATAPFTRIAAEEPPVTPSLAFVKTPVWDAIEPETADAFGELIAAIGERVAERILPEAVREAWDWHRTIMEADIAASFAAEYERGRDRLSESLRGQIERGRRVPAVDYIEALARIDWLNRGFEEVFDRFDAIVTPAAAGPAPAGLGSTGDPKFCTLWTLCGMPALNVPLMTAANGLPLGVQLVGRRGDDARLLRTARWLVERVRASVDGD
jgi:Asp-tRNA(Asn)/Glu-tRNA(Gln) amidotransferase A subunit family amidase